MNREAFLQGFAEKCAELGVDPIALAKAAQTAAATPAPKPVARWHHVVQPGETPSGIAAHYGVSLPSLQQFNPAGSLKVIKPGQKVYLEGDTATADTTVKPDNAKVTYNPENQHKVVKGDTLWGISQKYKVPMAALLRMNPGINPKALQIGSLINR